MKKIDLNDVLINFVKNASHLPGWEVHEHGDATIMVTPTDSPKLKLCIGPTTPEDIAFAANLFGKKGFGVLHAQSLDMPESHEVVVSVELTQMYLALKTAPRFEEDPQIETVTSHEGLRQWADLHSAIDPIDPESVFTFLLPFLNDPSQEVYNLSVDGQPVATGLLYISSDGIAQISSIGVTDEYRRQGIGTRIMIHALARAQKLGCETAALHASEMGKYLYGKHNFKVAHKENFTLLQPK